MSDDIAFVNDLFDRAGWTKEDSEAFLRYPQVELGVTNIGHRHFVRPNGFGGYLWWHDCPAVEHVSWGWFGPGDGGASGHVIDNHDPLTVRGSLICLDCRDHGFITAGAWVPA